MEKITIVYETDNLEEAEEIISKINEIKFKHMPKIAQEGAD